MYEWSDEHRMIRDAVRQWVEAEVRPRREELEFGDTPPYDVIRSTRIIDGSNVSFFPMIAPFVAYSYGSVS